MNRRWKPGNVMMLMPGLSGIYLVILPARLSPFGLQTTSFPPDSIRRGIYLIEGRIPFHIMLRQPSRQ